MSKDNPIVKKELKEVKNIIIVASGKGGVGKSTVAASLAMTLAMEGYSTGLLDADIYGPSLPMMFDIQQCRPTVVEENGKTMIEPIVRFGIKLMSIGLFVDPAKAAIWRGPLAASGMKQMIDQTQWGKLDYLIVDTPPGTGDIHISLLQEYKVSGVVIVTTPQMLSTGDVQKAINLYADKTIGVPVLGVIENMAWFTPENHPEEKYILFGKGGGDALAKKFSVPLLAQIPLNEKLCQECDYGKMNEVINSSLIKTHFDSIANQITKQLPVTE
ncbi:MAG: Mrp/NBP35 family ATP-binding protein [Bacteroidales bacterium]|nr:Mrp/NBP35 family ATP-binding protein [Bacteroidales bacterium]MDD4656118.1 Mrp/NBP35 family ATP-binding protein [Bacteroidales bacterium]